MIQLELLNLGKNNIGDEGASVLARSLTSMSNLRKLNLRVNRIGDEGLSALAVGLVNKGIVELWI